VIRPKDIYMANNRTGENMNIAVPTNDGLSIAEHFGRSAGFLLFQTESGRITSRQLKENTAQHTHAQSNCASHSGPVGAHDHAAILSALAGCEVVICAGMGWRAAEALKQAGVREVIVTKPGPVEEQVQAYLRGELTSTGETFCQCSH
jgi:predicted Fe-Mo cluster-binding NifX family protein